MKILKLGSFLILFFTTYSVLLSQQPDTVYLSKSDINTSVLREGTHRYLVYFKLGENATRTQTQFWTRNIRRTTYKNIPVLEISQEWEDKDSIVHVVKSFSDAQTLQPLYHLTWWKTLPSRNATEKVVTETQVDFLADSVRYNGRYLGNSETEDREKKIWTAYQSARGQYFLNWHLDLETFPTLPFRSGVTFAIPYYDPGTGTELAYVYYQVRGSEMLSGYDDQGIDCWVLYHESPGNKETFYISKQTREVLKLEQEFGNKMFRYKIKLAYSE